MRVPYGPLRTDAVLQIPSTIRTRNDASHALAQFLRSNSPTLLLTGAGISTPSGIPDYRGKEGTYIVNKTYRPIFYNEFKARHVSRQRYWARSFLGYPPVASARPNTIHTHVNEMIRSGIFHAIVTQNVDGLHTYDDPHLQNVTTEIHGSLHKVVCLDCTEMIHRREVQDHMRQLNPAWVSLELPTRSTTEGRREIKTNPDGDVDLPQSSGVTYETFRYPACRKCVVDGTAEIDSEGAWVSGKGVLKPSVVFFGESVPVENKVASDRALQGAKGLLCMGTSLAVYSAFRFVKAARAQGIPIAILNQGHVRDEEKWIDANFGDVRINMAAEEILPMTWNLLKS